ncbi:NAD(P)/FAD-dependent oxidoreductase [Myroides marinus]|uniref:NADH:ubiquinone reductase (non-electrogenic) n=1 Tax=Myroides marinus TaxID=703342 RepID=A0A161S1H4_9FLAO|nr:NAD(P)/FAD-dependent oxidoreductase [Myroides marinus]KUF43294.1 NADH dehydrogenase [Myroides marinus]KZE78009.1 NADH dehydrogenase [Myroides marinus]MDM1346645.1 NAD(P)/FAD-dependent oxidoreductase [Myroides marinus]MDM1349586.1 NAD(P)/FAD-dependent oxidoreductase [Myroides marinus]MDM1354861.1 NAD(P)/FAD-dependent oxidoreductase [Myroides marinus]
MMNIPTSNRPRVVIIGGGFGGLALAKKLKNKNFQVVLLDKHNYHTFQPLLYQVATGGLESGSIAYPIRKVVQDYDQIYFRMANVERIDTENKKVVSDIGTIFYDYVVIATGSKTNFFGNENITKNSMAMKTIPESLDIRSLVLENFEEALQTTDDKEQKALMNFVIVGAGPTGVELAGALAEMKRHVLPKDYPDLDFNKMEINVIQGANKVLDAMSEKSSKKAQEFLEKLGVKVYLGEIVTDYKDKVVYTKSGKEFTAETVIWTAGVMGAAVDGFDATVIQRGNRIKVNEFNQVEGFTDIFAIGDVATMMTEKTPMGHPMMAQPAIQQGELLASNLVRLRDGQSLKSFVYNDKGSMATIGRNKAVVDLPKFQFSGFFAWFVWMFVHLMSLIGFRNKLVVFWNWMYNYLMFDRQARLIIRPFKNKRDER